MLAQRKVVPTTVTLAPETVDRLDRVAKEQGRSRSFLIRDAVAKALVVLEAKTEDDVAE